MKFFTEPGKWANFLTAGDAEKPSLWYICGISRLVNVTGYWEIWEGLVLAQ